MRGATPPPERGSPRSSARLATLLVLATAALGIYTSLPTVLAAAAGLGVALWLSRSASLLLRLTLTAVATLAASLGVEIVGAIHRYSRASGGPPPDVPLYLDAMQHGALVAAAAWALLIVETLLRRLR